MSLRKVMQKQTKKTIVETKHIEMAPIFVDTICDVAGGTTTWEEIYNRMEDERPKITITRATAGSTKAS